ncbi:MAG TPA: type II toxin-antitoxin system VapB family antitoxin [Candidatus Binatia bacterium]|jgi:antitoxin VapB|nr:type II toxin-antitoxin system VapB family antitoxin [Candidatus Binatia bacterium]
MALTIEHPEVDRLARELAATTGESLTEVVPQALRERLIREQRRERRLHVRDALRAIRERCAKLPVLDTHSPEEILGYDDIGVPR